MRGRDGMIYVWCLQLGGDSYLLDPTNIEAKVNKDHWADKKQVLKNLQVTQLDLKNNCLTF